LARAMVKEAGIPVGAGDAGFDEAYERSIAGMLAGSGLDRALLLAQDEVYHADGPSADIASFFLPNDHLVAVCRRHPAFLPAVSIHPGRPGAMEELERCLSLGARALKLLPNCQNVDCSLPAYRPFWEKMASAGLPLLSHTGGELTVPVFNRAFEDPRILRRPLELGVKVIAAHGASSSIPWSRGHLDELLRLMDEFPHLYADTSALNSPVRSAILRGVLACRHRGRFLHGSDHPVPVGAVWPWLRGLIPAAARRAASAERNPLARDRMLKQAMGFDPEHFTRLAEVLRPL
ncbi:MAG: amidohydrolase family protein, partial [Verrucomicrobiota bacterium]